MIRTVLFFIGATFPSAVLAQTQEPLTPPIQPKTAPVVTPPAIVVPAPSGSAQPQPITAQEAAAIALKHQPQVAVARAAILTAHGNVLVAESLLVPTVALQGGYSRAYSLPFVGTPNSIGLLGQGFSASASVTQLLFDFGKTLDTVRLNRAQEAAAGFGLTTTESDIVYTVKQDFYTLVQDLRAVDVSAANLKDRQDNLALAQARLNAGIGEPGDVVTAETNVASATVNLVAARATASTAEVALALAMGLDPRTPILPADSQEPSIPIDNVDALVDQGLKQRPEVQQQQQLLRAAGYSVSVARKYLLPSIGLTAGTASGGSNSGGSTGTGYRLPTSAALGIVLTWNPFDVLGARGRLDIARGDQQTSQANLQLAALTVVSDVSNAFVNIKSAEQRIVTSQAEVTNGLEGLRIAEGQYRAGVATFVVVTDAEANLAQARTDLVNAQAALQLARAAMEHAIGRPL